MTGRAVAASSTGPAAAAMHKRSAQTIRGENACQEQRICSRCLTQEDREAHDYQLISEMYWGYDLFSRCEFRCSKCGDTRIEGILPPDYEE